MPDRHELNFFDDAQLARALYAPLSPIEPERRFAVRLRARLERALTLPKGVDVSITTLEQEASTTAPVKMEVTPYLAVAGARRALAWYGEVFGATPTGEQVVGDDGEVHHAELDFGGALVMVSEEHPEISHTAPQPGAGNSVSIHLQVPEVDALVERAVSAGAILDRQPSDNPYGRIGVIRDPFGHRWMLMSPPPAGAASASGAGAAARYPGGTRQGDIGYISFEVPDLALAVAFYGAVLGWRFEPGDVRPGRTVVDSMPMTSLWGGAERGLPVICWRVDDLGVAIEAVRRLGGSATDPDHRPYGTMSDCVDDQGMRFYLWQPTEVEARSGAAITDRPSNGTQNGDLSYMTMEVVDSARFRAFFGVVLGWSFTPGRVADGWSPSDPMPMHGMHGGQQVDVAVPMWRVGDIHSAVERVASLGGSASPVERQPYGLSATCTDNQGTRFYLHQP